MKGSPSGAALLLFALVQPPDRGLGYFDRVSRRIADVDRESAVLPLVLLLDGNALGAELTAPSGEFCGVTGAEADMPLSFGAMAGNADLRVILPEMVRVEDQQHPPPTDEEDETVWDRSLDDQPEHIGVEPLYRADVAGEKERF